MKHLRLGTKIGILIGVLVLTAGVIGAVGLYQLRSVNRQVQQMVDTTGRELADCSQMEIVLLQGIRSEKNVVITEDEDEAKQFAEQARASWQTVNQLRQTLGQLIESVDDPEEKRYFDEFNKNWEEFQKISRQSLALAVQKTSARATKLIQGDLNDKAQAGHDALQSAQQMIEKEITDIQSSTDFSRLHDAHVRSRQAAAANAALWELYRLVVRHVIASSEEEMNRLDERIKTQERDVETKLEALANVGNERERAAVGRTLATLQDSKKLAAEVQRLSHMNSNFLSMKLAVGAYRKHADDCTSNLAKLRERFMQRFRTDRDNIANAYALAGTSIIGVSISGILVSLVLSLVVTRSITRPLAESVTLSQAMAKGDLTRRLRLTQEDEVGQLASAMDGLAETLSTIVVDIRGVSQGVAGSATDLSAISQQLLASSEEMATQATAVAGATEQMSTNISTMAAAAEEVSMNVVSISSASEEISANVATISTAADATATNVSTVAKSIADMTQAFAGIAQDAKAGSETATRATELAGRATETMQALDRAAGEINKVTEVIKMIALQTNLLALNATIEATAAGEAGKGFAVVAHEIKELAQQSGRAAEDIARKIEGVQTSTRGAVTVIGEVAGIIGTINTSAGRISALVGQQTQTADRISHNVTEASQGVGHIAASIAEVAKGANDMSRNAAEAAKGANDMSANVSEAAKGARDVASNIHGVSNASQENSTSAQRVNASARQLADIAGELQRLVGQFRIKERDL